MGGYKLLNTWLTSSKASNNVPFLQQILLTLQHLPLTVDHLKQVREAPPGPPRDFLGPSRFLWAPPGMVLGSPCGFCAPFGWFLASLGWFLGLPQGSGSPLGWFLGPL